MRGTPNGTQLVDALETFLKRYLVLAPGLPFRGLEARLHGIVLFFSVGVVEAQRTHTTEGLMTSNGLSTTDNLHFASFLDATNLLTFVDCIPAGVGSKILLRFRDPRHQLSKLYENYASGAECAAIDFSASLRRPRREMGGVERTLSTEGASREHYR